MFPFCLLLIRFISCNFGNSFGKFQDRQTNREREIERDTERERQIDRQTDRILFSFFLISVTFLAFWTNGIDDVCVCERER